METPNYIHTLLIGLFSGEITPEEKKAVDAWLRQSAGNRKFYADFREIWLACGVPGNADHYQTEKAIKLFKEKVASEKPVKKIVIPPVFMKYAAILLLIIALPVSYYLGRYTGKIQSGMVSVSCAYGDRTDIILPDSSHVWLNSGSKLSFDNNFEKYGRNLFLEGEAYFSVRKNKKSPFRVKTKEIEVEVLGTEFNLKAYSDDSDVSATLVSGSLKINSKTQQTLLSPSQKITYSKRSRQMTLDKLTDTRPETDWKEGRLVFKNKSLEDLKPKLERWFDVEVVFADNAVKERRFTGSLQRESILEAVSYFGLSKHVAYQYNGNKIIFYSK